MPAKLTRSRLIERMALLAFVLLLALAAFAFSPGCGGPAPSAEHITFRSRDGFLLDGRLFGKGTTAVVLSHMYPSDQSSWFSFADLLAKDGYTALTFDFRGYGKSQGTKRIGLIDRDVIAAVNYLEEKKGARKIVLIGASMGGTASLIAASKLEVVGVATLSAPVEFMGLNAEHATFSAKARKLFIASRDDPAGAATSARALLHADPASDLLLLPGDAHGTDILKESRSKEAIERLLDFIKEVTD